MMLTKNQILDVIKRTLVAYKTSILDKQYATMQYVDDNKFSGDYNDLINTPVKENCNFLMNNEEFSSDNKFNNAFYKQLDYSCGLVEGNNYTVEIIDLNTNHVYTQNITCTSLPLDGETSVNRLEFFEKDFLFQFIDKVFIESFENSSAVYSENNSVITFSSDATSVGSYSVTIKQILIRKLDEKFLPDGVIRTMTLKLNADELNFIQNKVTDDYNNELEYITRRDLSFIISNNIETIIFKDLEKWPYKVVGAYYGFGNNERIVLERAISDTAEDYYAVHRIMIKYSDDFRGCFLSSYYGDLTEINALTLDNTTEYIPTTDYNPSTKKYVDDTVNTNRIDMCTDEEINDFLSTTLVVNEDDDNVFIHHIIEPN